MAGGLIQGLIESTGVRIQTFFFDNSSFFLGLLELPVNIVLSPITIPRAIIYSAPRGFGIPKLISDLTLSTVFAVSTLGTSNLVLDLGKKLICRSNCRNCCGWRALTCSMCRGSGKVQYQVKNCDSRREEMVTAGAVAASIAENQAELLYFPATMEFHAPLPTRVCPTCNGDGVMKCPKCEQLLPFVVSVDKIIEPPSRAHDIMKKMHYPLEKIDSAMNTDAGISAFFLFNYPQIVGGLVLDYGQKEEVRSKYRESMRYDELREWVANREEGWEGVQNELIAMDPVRAMEDQVVVRNVPYYKAMKTLECEVLRLRPPPRPEKWGEFVLPLSASHWSEDDMKNQKKAEEKTLLLRAQHQLADCILNAEWEKEWRRVKVGELLEEKIGPYMEEVDEGVLPPHIVVQSKLDDSKGVLSKKRRWWFF